MTTRDIFLRTLDFDTSVRTLNWEFGYWGGALNRWYNEGLELKEGLKREVTYGESICGPALHWPIPSLSSEILRDKDVAVSFSFDEPLTSVPYNFWIYPKYESKIIREDDSLREIVDTDGIRKLVRKDDSSMPYFIEWPVKNEKDWEKITEERLSCRNLLSRFVGDIPEFKKTAADRTFPLALLGDPAGFFGSLRFLLGEVNLFLLYYDNPKLIKKMTAYLCDLWIQMCEELLTISDFDCVLFWEDMSGKQGSLISPAAFKEFMTPCYKRIIDFLKTKGLKHFIVDTDGYVLELIPLFLEAGITGMYPFEVQANNDILKIRKKHPRLQILGGCNKNAAACDEKEIDKEIFKIKKMLKFGGYIPFMDHLIPPNVSWNNYFYFRQKTIETIYS